MPLRNGDREGEARSRYADDVHRRTKFIPPPPSPIALRLSDSSIDRPARTTIMYRAYIFVPKNTRTSAEHFSLDLARRLNECPLGTADD